MNANVSQKRLKVSRLMPLALAWSLSLAYIFSLGIDWAWTWKSGTFTEALFTGAILSVWAAAPYLVLLPMARRESRINALLNIPAVLAILVFSFVEMYKARNRPGDEGGSYIVVPAQQLVVAILIVVGLTGAPSLYDNIKSKFH